MTRGFTMTDPMLFNQEGIKRFSKTVPRSKQKLLYSLIRDVYGHMEFQYGKIQGKNIITFFDYSDQEGYIEIDNIWTDLITYFQTKQKKSAKYIYGLPAALGKATGKVVILHHDNIGMYPEVEKGSIIVSDTTTPEMTPIMAKAAAIVTDLGGITSHAAIVCRELKYPRNCGNKKCYREVANWRHCLCGCRPRGSKNPRLTLFFYSINYNCVYARNTAFSSVWKGN